ncbi:MAG: hypothetical protein ACQES9_07955 [Myxococcota bacterium]
MAKKSYDEIVNNIFKFFSLKQNKSIKKSAVEEYCNHTDNKYDSWDKLFEKLKKGNGEWRIIVTDKENEEYRIVPANVPFDENAPPKPPAKISSNKKSKKRHLANADTARKTAKTKNKKSVKRKNKKKARSAGRKSKYGDYSKKASRILNALSENRYYDKNKLVAIAKNIGVSIGVWNTLLKHLRKGTKTHDFVDNGMGGISKKYKLVPKQAKKLVKKSTAKPAKVANKKVQKTPVDKPVAPKEDSQPPQVKSDETSVQSKESSDQAASDQKAEQKAKIKIPGDGRPVSITINIEIG